MTEKEFKELKVGDIIRDRIKKSNIGYYYDILCIIDYIKIDANIVLHLGCLIISIGANTSDIYRNLNEDTIWSVFPNEYNHITKLS